MATDNRPISPHLQVYRPQLTSVLSISHRISGVLLSIGLVLVVAWLLALAAGPERFAALSGFLASVPVLLVLVAWTAALFYHLLNGIRHLLWDAGWLLDLRGAYASGWTVVGLAGALTVIAWGVWL
ncbi:succinate dehydrogenase, cytochrome b556 subunit [Wenzhouxiangella limi]|uniref:Succinate dehydrogenase cytochrome b556 subunit n=1 Tax=Wenzhouxiangella limi TaxID=2707351 RepID=A0A845V4F3_9GAMM|nr:succinate dehydrogenase, cytochrome b556 subunit [Wenzhouxiangella limi]NDY94845.1 succinate dehydrogenase, cytochrome b556 subunit [Wenzhouxiangella limi]